MNGNKILAVLGLILLAGKKLMGSASFVRPENFIIFTVYNSNLTRLKQVSLIVSDLEVSRYAQQHNSESVIGLPEYEGRARMPYENMLPFGSLVYHKGKLQ